MVLATPEYIASVMALSSVSQSFAGLAPVTIAKGAINGIATELVSGMAGQS